MSTQSMLTRLIAPLAVAASLAGLSATAEAATYKPLCGGGLCFYKDTQAYTNHRTYFYLTFSGSAVTHYNIIYREPGGRSVQAEISTRPGSNMSNRVSLPGTPGQQYKVSVQACNRTKAFIGPIVISSRSSCTTWYTTTYTAV